MSNNMKWQNELKNSIRKPEQLVELGVIDQNDLEHIKGIRREFTFPINNKHYWLDDIPEAQFLCKNGEE